MNSRPKIDGCIAPVPQNRRVQLHPLTRTNKGPDIIQVIYFSSFFWKMVEYPKKIWTGHPSSESPVVAPGMHTCLRKLKQQEEAGCGFQEIETAR